MGIHFEGIDIGMAILGGALIALSSIANLYLKGRITGLSGMFYTLITLNTNTGLIWKFSFLSGLLTSMYILYITIGDFIYFGSYKYYIFDSNSTAIKDLSEPGWVIGGLLVGLGTKIGNGCTSGHGVCGIPRFSIRSFIAVGTFMAFGIFMATIKYYYPYFT